MRRSEIAFVVAILAVLLFALLLPACGTTTTGTTSSDSFPQGQVRIDLSLYPPIPSLAGLDPETAKAVLLTWGEALKAVSGNPLPSSFAVTVTATIDRSTKGSQTVSPTTEAQLQATVRDLFKPGG